MRHFGIATLVLAALSIAWASPASADPIDLQVGRISNNADQNLSSHFGVALEDNGDGTASFTFTNAFANDDTIDPVITKVFFASDLSTYLDFSTGDETESDGVSFTSGHNGLGNFNWTVVDGDKYGYGLVAVPPPVVNGIDNVLENDEEYLTVTFDLQSGYDFDDLLGALGPSSTLTGYGIGFHVQRIGEESDWYGVVPEPTSIALFGLGAVGLVALRRRRRA